MKKFKKFDMDYEAIKEYRLTQEQAGGIQNKEDFCNGAVSGIIRFRKRVVQELRKRKLADLADEINDLGRYD